MQTDSIMIGITVSKLAYTISDDPNPPADKYTDSVPDKERRVLAIGGTWIDNFIAHASDLRWRNISGRIPLSILEQAFTFDELCRIWFSGGGGSRLSDHMATEHPVLEKIRLSIWNHGSGIDFDTFASAARGMSCLAWPDAEVRIVYTGRYSCDGPAQDIPREASLWIDNDFGALIYVGGKHVLTVAFGIGKEGIFLAQVQVRAKKGNRFLFKLQAHYLDVALSMLATAFPGLPLWLVTGASAVNAVRKSYGKSPCSMTEETEARITSLYDRPLGAYLRSSNETTHHEGRTYVKLSRKLDEYLKAA